MSDSTIDDTPEQMRNMRATARPLIFHTGISEAPVSTQGTCFLVGYKGRLFVVTAAHLIGQLPSTEVIVLPSDGSTAKMKLSNGFKMESDPDGLDEYDVIVYEASLQRIPKSDAQASRLIRLDNAPATDWMLGSFTALFFLLGHPAEINDVDYDAGLVQTSQVVLAGRYLGSAELQPSLHRLQLQNPLNLKHFRGMSGGPVMSLETRLASTPVTRFCGVAVWGAVESGIVHFLEARVILHLLDEAIAYWDRPSVIAAA